jgi:hypothetical protein
VLGDLSWDLIGWSQSGMCFTALHSDSFIVSWSGPAFQILKRVCRYTAKRSPNYCVRDAQGRQKDTSSAGSFIESCVSTTFFPNIISVLLFLIVTDGCHSKCCIRGIAGCNRRRLMISFSHRWLVVRQKASIVCL